MLRFVVIVSGLGLSLVIFVSRAGAQDNSVLTYQWTPDSLMQDLKPEPPAAAAPPVDLYRERIERITNTAEAQQLRYEICVAVDNYARLFEKHGLTVHISLGRNTEPPSNPNNVVVFSDWDGVRNRQNGNGDGGKAA